MIDGLLGRIGSCLGHPVEEVEELKWAELVENKPRPHGQTVGRQRMVGAGAVTWAKAEVTAARWPGEEGDKFGEKMIELENKFNVKMAESSEILQLITGSQRKVRAEGSVVQLNLFVIKREI